MSTLYLVATPIGNLADISTRALNTLREVTLVAAEDTRHTAKLLQHYGIRTSCISYHEHNKQTRLAGVLEAMQQGDVALVSDAGTPALNDPGYELVRAVIEAGHTVSPIPGPCAPIAALVASGLPTDAFIYLGYLPRKSHDRQRRLENLANLPYTLIFLETPRRLLSALQDLQSKLGDRQVAVARELTKIHEEIFRGSLAEARVHFTQNAPRGELTLVVEGGKIQAGRWAAERLYAEAESHLNRGEGLSQVAAGLTSPSGWSRREIYRYLLEKHGKLKPDHS